MYTDPIADYLTRIRNAIMAKHKVVSIPSSRLKKEITKQILAKATIFKKQSKDKNFKPYQMSTPGD